MKAKNPPVRNQDNQYLQKLLVELTHSKAKLEEDRLRTEAMINSLGEGLIVTDEHGKITTINPYALKCLGFEKHELIGTWFPKTVVSVDQHALPTSQLNRPIIRALTTGEAVSEHMYYQRKDGASIPVFITVAPVLIAGRPAGAIEVFRDLTRESQLDFAKDEFVSLASHQLRTPATGVKLVLSMLASGDFGELTPLQLKYLDKAVESNNRQLHIIEDLLNVARVNAGKMNLDFEYADLAKILREVITEHGAIIQSRHQKIRLRSPRQLTAFIDVSKIHMVIDNLISNASKYSTPGETIDLSLRRDGLFAVLKFTDHGVGMSSEDIAKIFTKFTRLKNELSASVGGTGLGLFLVKNIVELHNGSVNAVSKEAVGSTFTVRLPINQSS